MYISILVDCERKQIVTAGSSQDIDDILVARLEGTSRSVLLLEADVFPTIDCILKRLPAADIPTRVLYAATIGLWIEFSDIDAGDLKRRCSATKQIRKVKHNAALQISAWVHLNHGVIRQT